jgi:hypothetical protein
LIDLQGHVVICDSESVEVPVIARTQRNVVRILLEDCYILKENEYTSHMQVYMDAY